MMTTLAFRDRAVHRAAAGAFAFLALTAAAGAQPPARHAVGVTALVPTTTVHSPRAASRDVPTGTSAEPWNHAAVGALVGVPVFTFALAAVLCSQATAIGGERNECGIPAAILGPPAGLFIGGALGYAHGIAAARGCDAPRTTLVSAGVLVLGAALTGAAVAAVQKSPGTHGRDAQVLGFAAGAGGLILTASTTTRIARRCTPLAGGASPP